jgi:predicted transglutaminase-like protease
LDTGRLHLQHKIDSHFNDIEIIKRFSKYTEVVHLWNVKVAGNLENKNVKIMFEHRSDLISDEELDSCYSWISEILGEGDVEKWKII